METNLERVARSEALDRELTSLITWGLFGNVACLVCMAAAHIFAILAGSLPLFAVCQLVSHLYLAPGFIEINNEIDRRVDAIMAAKKELRRAALHHPQQDG